MLVDKILRVSAFQVVIYFSTDRKPVAISCSNGHALELAWLILGVTNENLEPTLIIEQPQACKVQVAS